jgi:CubicO group peptidase (beta-lactamase class C family)
MKAYLQVLLSFTQNMASLLARSVSFFLLLSSALSTFTPCPLLGPAFPPFVLDTNHTIVRNALENLTANFDQLVQTGTGPNGDVSPNTTFSVALFSANKGTAEEEPFFWEYHYTSPALRMTNHLSQNVTKDSIYRIGGLTEVFTVWSLLLAEGDQIFNDPVVKYLPELANTSKEQLDTIYLVKWSDVTVGQLASHMSGIARDCK